MYEISIDEDTSNEFCLHGMYCLQKYIYVCYSLCAVADGCTS